MGGHGRWALGLAVLTAALVAAPSAGADRILFIDARDGPSEVWVMNEDGSGQRAITDRVPEGSSPAWSPDGSRIAFTGWGITVRPWILAPDGSVLRPLGFGSCWRPGGGCAPDWSPNGRWLVLSSRRDIFIVQRDGSPSRRLTRGGLNLDPAWSPTGGWIVFRSGQGLTLIRPDGTGRRVIGPGREPDWSPTGDRIVFVDWARHGGRDLYTMRTDGSDRRRLTRTPLQDEHMPAWSPGGRKIAFERDGALWVMRANGTGARRVFADAGSPAWAPSGGRLAFTHIFDPNSRPIPVLSTIRADGSGFRRLLTPESDDGVVASPDGRRIAYSSFRPFSQSGVYIADADGGNETFVHPGREPRFSPDGSRLMVVHDGGVYVVGVDGSDPAPIPFPSAAGIESTSDWQWHPDGRVSFVGMTDDVCGDVYTMGLDGTDVTRVTPAACAPNVLGGFDWNTAGTTLVFSGRGAGACESCRFRLFSQTVPGGAPTALMTADSDFAPSLSPDGAEVVFLRVLKGGESIWTVNLDGTGETRLTFGRAEYAPAWLPEPP